MKIINRVISVNITDMFWTVTDNFGIVATYDKAKREHIEHEYDMDFLSYLNKYGNKMLDTDVVFDVEVIPLTNKFNVKTYESFKIFNN